MANALRYVLQQVVKKGLSREKMLHQTLEKGELGRQLGVQDKDFQAVGALEEAQKFEKGAWSRERWEVGWRAVRDSFAGILCVDKMNECLACGFELLVPAGQHGYCFSAGLAQGPGGS